MSFTNFSLSPELQRSIRDCGYHSPTPVQQEAIPVSLDGRDLVVSAETGSGKTAAFLIPLIDRLHRVHAKGPSALPADKRLAVQVEDHPIEYGSFEGTIPQGPYGGGSVMVWDFGTWEPLEDADKGLEKGHLKFNLNGQKLHGR